MSRGLCIECGDSVFCSATGCEAASPIALRLSLEVRSCVERIARENEREPELLLGVPLVRRVCENGGHICFSLTDEAYEAATRRIITEAPMPPPVEANDGAAYAYMRARMYAEKFFSGDISCPADESVKNALWQCMGLSQSGIRPFEAKTRLAHASAAVLAAAGGLSFIGRQNVLRTSGGGAACVARLLYFAISHIGG